MPVASGIVPQGFSHSTNIEAKRGGDRSSRSCLVLLVRWSDCRRPLRGRRPRKLRFRSRCRGEASLLGRRARSARRQCFCPSPARSGHRKVTGDCGSPRTQNAINRSTKMRCTRGVMAGRRALGIQASVAGEDRGAHWWPDYVTRKVIVRASRRPSAALRRHLARFTELHRSQLTSLSLVAVANAHH